MNIFYNSKFFNRKMEIRARGLLERNWVVCPDFYAYGIKSYNVSKKSLYLQVVSTIV